MLTFTKGINLDFFHILKKYLYQRNYQLKVNNCFLKMVSVQDIQVRITKTSGNENFLKVICSLNLIKN